MMSGSKVDNPLDLPSAIAARLIPFIADVIEFAHSASSGRWGLTDHGPNIRINVGWTEILTTNENYLRLIVDWTCEFQIDVPKSVKILKRDNRLDYYRHIANSICILLPYKPFTIFSTTIDKLKPAL